MSKLGTGSFSLMKNMNTALILGIIRENGHISRANVAKVSGLTPATVTNITQELINIGIVSEAERGVSKGGRKPVMLKICGDAFNTIGIYMGSKIFQIVLTNMDAKIIDTFEILNPTTVTQEEAMNITIGAIKEMFKVSKKPIIGIGVGIHGLVKRDEGIAIFAPNLGWENVRIKDVFESEFNIPVFVDNDVRAMTNGEKLFGSAQKITDFLLLYVGSGIGGSIVIDGNVYEGATGVAGEFGHTTIIPDGEYCTCGNRGCLQTLASEIKVLKTYKANKNISDDKIDIEYVIQKAMIGDKEAVDAITQAATYIGIGLANLINIFNPSLVIISGNIVRLGSVVMNTINSELASRCMEYTQNSTRIVFSKNKNEGFLKGAASLVINEIYENPVKLIEKTLLF